MRDPFSRLLRTKTLLIALSMGVVGLGIVGLDRYLDRRGVADALRAYVPLSEVGGTLLGAALFSIWLDHLLRREQQAVEEQRLRALLHEQAPALRDAVLSAFAADRDDLKRVATPELLDGIITNSLALRLEDEQFASEIYADVRDQAIRASERWTDASVSIELSPTVPVYRAGRADPTFRSSDRYFTVTVRWEYTTVPTHAQRRFMCTSDRDEYNEVANARSDTTGWFMSPTSGQDAAALESFELTRFSVDGDPRPIRRSVRKGGQIFTAAVGADTVSAGQPVTISYTYRTVTAQAGHLLYFSVEQPTRDLRMSFDYGQCGMSSVSVLDLVPTIRPPRIERPRPGDSSPVIHLDVDGWVFPRSGVGFVWTLVGERRRTRASDSTK